SPSVMWPVARCETKMSQHRPVASTCCGTRLWASELNATTLPSAEIDGVKLEPLACVPSEATLTSRVVPVCRSRTKMSELSFASSGTRLSPHDEKATYRPSAEADGQLLFDDVSP